MGLTVDYWLISFLIKISSRVHNHKSSSLPDYITGTTVRFVSLVAFSQPALPRLWILSKDRAVPHHAMKANWGAERLLPSFLPSALDGGEWTASHPSCFTSTKTSAVTHWIGGWLDPRTGPDVLEDRKIFCLCWEVNHNSSVIQPVV